MTPIRSFSRTYSSHFISSEQHAAEGEAFRGSQAPMEEAGPCCSGTEAKQRTPACVLCWCQGSGTRQRHWLAPQSSGMASFSCDWAEAQTGHSITEPGQQVCPGCW
ncbi:uncharacterized protein LOC144049286 isoform X2 [Vanacampus margaritifer]